jgi:type II secretory pathway pseudopilin PulG
MKKQAFTLAEVLITLVTIGVVAALTIPNVVRNYQKTQTVTQLKKIYSALANTTNLAIAGYGPVTGWEIGEDYSPQAAVDFANTYLIPYLKVGKNCESTTTGSCKYDYRNSKEGSIYTLPDYYTRFYLNDGTLVALQIENRIVDGLLYKHARVKVDINGNKPPNLIGKDSFNFIYYIYSGTQSNRVNGKFTVEALGYDRETLKSTGCSDGAQYGYSWCTALLVKDNWQIKDDYPW